jgi:rod shape-determining protein MreD
LGVCFTLIRGAWSNALGLGLFDFDLLTIITVYLFLFCGQTFSGIFALGQGLLMDLFSGGPNGLFAALYMAVFGAIYLGYRLFNLQGAKGQMLLITSVVLLKEALFFAGLSVFSVDAVFSESYLWISAISAMATGVMGPMLFQLFDGLRAISPGLARNGSEDQLQG